MHREENDRDLLVRLPLLGTAPAPYSTVKRPLIVWWGVLHGLR